MGYIRGIVWKGVDNIRTVGLALSVIYALDVLITSTLIDVFVFIDVPDILFFKMWMFLI